MTNFTVNFTNAWWLLLLIPAFGLTLFSYFKLNKRYRFTRNRIVSMVLHLVIMVLSIALLAGLTVEYFVPNTETEVILLVDSSYTMDDTDKETDNFVNEVVKNCNSMYKLGIVKFGYDQVYAVELTNEMDKVYSTYLTSKNPDTTATDLAAALEYTSTLFSSPETSRIVLITDALETDGKARDVIKAIAAKGIAVDTVYFPGEDVTNEVQIVSAEKSVEKIDIDTSFTMDLTIESSFEGKATITPYDNNEPGADVKVTLKAGTQTVSIPYSFPWGGLHVVSFEIKSEQDTVLQNNSYCNYIYIETFTEVLVIESIKNESSSLVDILGEELNVKVVDVDDDAQMPTTLEELRNYDEIVLLNVANHELPEGFDVILQQYVHDIGGGLFTVCGNEKVPDAGDDWTANAYVRKDMYGSIYQDMLPVEIIDYTAPVGVIIVIDCSGSMLGGNFEETKFYWALEGARASLDALTERDYVGVMTLADSYTEELSLTPRTQRTKILSSITDLEVAARNNTLPSGGTLFSPALERAGKALAARSDLEKKHIIIVTDCQPATDDQSKYRSMALENAALGITMSVVGVNVNDGDAAAIEMEDLLVNYAKCDAKNLHCIGAGQYDTLPSVMREELEGPEIKSVNYDPFVPTINVLNSITTEVNREINDPANPKEMPKLQGYYGVKLKKDATAVLMGNYTPIYSQWQYGKGSVGTFACDLSGNWSADFMDSEIGEKLVNKIIYALFPAENIRVNDIEATITGDNYTTNLSIFTELRENESLKVTVTSDLTNAIQTFELNHTTGYSRLNFATKDVGLHTIFIQKLDNEGKEISHNTFYKTLSYSKEYDAFEDKDEAKSLAEQISVQTNGYSIKSPSEVFENAVEYLHVVIDPRIAFAIIIIVCFLLDIAARKFKWKWPHEIINDKKRIKTKKEQEGA